MSASQKNKGKRGELELARFLTDHGHLARRGVQYCGGPDSPDIVCESLPIHFEVKRTEHLRIHESMRQAIRDAGDMTPAVAHRRNRDDWLVTMRLSDLLTLVQ
jgi:Holliday junction resolvase